MSDILICGVAEAAVTEIDRRAREQGLSRAEYLRRRLDLEHHATPATSVAAGDWPPCALSVPDLIIAAVAEESRLIILHQDKDST